MNDYGVDLARIHHEGHADLARRAGPGITSHLRDAGLRRGLIVDLGCGSGILARYLLDKGYQILGVDPSAAMLQIARRVAPLARFIQKRAEDVTLPSCIAVIATGEALTYLPPRITPTAHLRRHIRRVSGALVPGGLFIIRRDHRGRVHADELSDVARRTRLGRARGRRRRSATSHSHQADHDIRAGRIHLPSVVHGASGWGVSTWRRTA
jgi:SAM-dependent methyltransferase